MNGRTPEAQTLTEIMLAVFRINGRLLEGGDRLVAPLDLTSARWQVLGAIALAGEPRTVPQVAEAMGMTRQGAQKQVNKLEEDGFVEARANPRHKRSAFYALTDKGGAAYRAVDELYSGWANALADGLPMARLEPALALLTEFERRLEHDTHVKG